MPETPTNTALTSLTSWWQEMGHQPDPALMKALAAASAQPAHAPPAAAKAARTAQDWAAIARTAAAGCATLEELKAAIEAFEGCPLKDGAQNTVVFDGVPGAPVMVIGEGPGAEEDRTGKPFVGRAGQLLDRMLAAIGLSRQTNVLISNVNYWRPPGNRNPEADELAVCRPFVERMVEITGPKLVIAAGGVPAKALLESGIGIMRLRGSEHVFTTGAGHSVPLFPIFHPAFLLRRPQEKSRAWHDLQMIERRAGELGLAISARANPGD